MAGTAAVGIRVVATVGLLFYPRLTNSSLTGWDAERFHEIATTDGRPWADSPVGYPPGTVAASRLVAGDGPISTNSDRNGTISQPLVVAAVAALIATVVLALGLGRHRLGGIETVGPGGG